MVRGTRPQMCIAHRGISRFRVRCYASPRNDGRWGNDALSFVERHGLWSVEQQEAAARLRRIVEEKNLEVIRLSFPAQHGIRGGQTLVASEAIASLESGCSIPSLLIPRPTSP